MRSWQNTELHSKNIVIKYENTANMSIPYDPKWEDYDAGVGAVGRFEKTINAKLHPRGGLDTYSTDDGRSFVRMFDGTFKPLDHPQVLGGLHPSWSERPDLGADKEIKRPGIPQGGFTVDAGLDHRPVKKTKKKAGKARKALAASFGIATAIAAAHFYMKTKQLSATDGGVNGVPIVYPERGEQPPFVDTGYRYAPKHRRGPVWGSQKKSGQRDGGMKGRSSRVNATRMQIRGDNSWITKN